MTVLLTDKTQFTQFNRLPYQVNAIYEQTNDGVAVLLMN